MACLFCSPSGGGGRQQLLLDEVKANSNATIKRDMEEYNFRLQACLIAKAKKLPLENIPDTPCVAGRWNCGINEDDSQPPVQYKGWLEFQCGTAQRHHDNPDPNKKPISSCDANHHLITGCFESLLPSGETGGLCVHVTGKWSPSGFCYWVEEHTTPSLPQKDIVFVVHDFSLSKSQQSATCILKNGQKSRLSRSMEMRPSTTAPSEQSTPTALIHQCPSVHTVFHL